MNNAGYMWPSFPTESVTVYPKKYAHGFCFAVLCCGYTLTDFLISIRLTSLALWQSNDCPSASKATLMNMDKYFMWIHYERLHNHNKAKHNKTVCTFHGIYCRSLQSFLCLVSFAKCRLPLHLGNFSSPWSREKGSLYFWSDWRRDGWCFNKVSHGLEGGCIIAIVITTHPPT